MSIYSNEERHLNKVDKKTQFVCKDIKLNLLKVGTLMQNYYKVMVLFIVLITGFSSVQAQYFDSDDAERSTDSFAEEANKVAEPARIYWRLENTFRLFTNAKSTQMHKEVFDSLSEQESETPILSTERLLSEKFSKGWADLVYQETCWDTFNKRYKHCNQKNTNYIFPQTHRIIANINIVDSYGEQCVWHVAPLSAKKAKRQKYYQRVRKDCTKKVALDIPYPEGARITVTVNRKQVVQQVITVKDIFVVGIGDSFASGEGNPDHPVQLSRKRAAYYGKDPSGKELKGYPTREGNWKKVGDKAFQSKAANWSAKPCHRSLYSYQLRAALQLALENPKRAVTYAGFACAGAQIPIGLFKKYKGTDWAKTYPFLPQISAVSNAICGEGSQAIEKDYTSAYSQLGRVPDLSELVLLKCYNKKRRKIDLLMVSIGGNDVGFSKIVAGAVLKKKSFLSKAATYGHGLKVARKELKELKHRYKALNKGLHYILGIPWSESDRIILTAYPSMSYQEDGVSLCNNTTGGLSLHSSFKLDKKKLKQGEEFGDELHDVMARSARSLGWTFVDEHRQSFKSHGFCATNSNGRYVDEENMSFPLYANGRWSGFNPADFRPYASRQRWFRTPNDAYLAVHYQAAGNIVKRIFRSKKLSWLQVLLAGTYSGAFHPTAEGHAAIADAVAVQAHAILKRYDEVE